MGKTSSISVRIDREDKQKAESVFRKLGLTASQAIVMFYKQVQLRNGIPFPVEIPNEATAAAIKETRSGLGRTFDTEDDLYQDLGV